MLYVDIKSTDGTEIFAELGCVGHPEVDLRCVPVYSHHSPCFLGSEKVSVKPWWFRI